MKKILISCLSLWAACGSEAQYVPEPEPVSMGEITVGAFCCPLWYEKNRPDCWEFIKPFPERTPVLGYYNETYPEVVDWEIKYALDHGISFFWGCWWRAKGNAGSSEVKGVLDEWYHEGFFKSRYQDRMKFAILWENTNDVGSSITSEADLTDNLMPYLIQTFLSRPNYMKVEGKPLMMIYGFSRFISDLGGREQARQAIAKMKQICEEAGLGGLYLTAEHHEHFDTDLSWLYGMGFDAIGSYHWPSFSGLMQEGETLDGDPLIALQQQCWKELDRVANGQPTILTASMGWDSAPWNYSFYKGQWQLTPAEFKTLCQKIKAHALSATPSPVSRIVMLDNWNEFGEGHYIFPTTGSSFGYLDAVRDAFADAPGDHTDVIPADLGLGPYDYEHTKTKNK